MYLCPSVCFLEEFSNRTYARLDPTQVPQAREFILGNGQSLVFCFADVTMRITSFMRLVLSHCGRV
jgi:hypothetical protein